MTDRTDAVIEAIDGALDGWSVSADAMRWTSEPPPEVRPPTLRLWRPTFVPPEVTERLMLAPPVVRFQVVAEVATFQRQLADLVQHVQEIFTAHPRVVSRLRWEAANIGLRQSRSDVRRAYRRRRMKRW